VPTAQRPTDTDALAAIDDATPALGSPILVDPAAEAVGLAEQEAQRTAEADARRELELQRQRDAEAAERRLAEVARQAEQEAQRKREAEEAARREREIAEAKEAERATRRQREAEAAALAAREAEQRRLATAAAARPNLRVFVEADVDDRAGLGGFTPSTYGNRLKAELGLAAQEALGAAAVATGDDNLPFRQLLRQGRDGLDQICRQAGSARVLLADVTIEAAGFSAIDSAYWPQLQIVAANCDNGRVQRSRKQRLEPHRLDRFGFQQNFAERAREFISSQGYFLAP
jgi:flagellar biosynthesis GTPase FlhF